MVYVCGHAVVISTLQAQQKTRSNLTSCDAHQQENLKTGRTKALQPGDEVMLIVDRDNPKRALIRDLYV